MATKFRFTFDVEKPVCLKGTLFVSSVTLSDRAVKIAEGLGVNTKDVKGLVANTIAAATEAAALEPAENGAAAGEALRKQYNASIKICLRWDGPANAASPERFVMLWPLLEAGYPTPGVTMTDPSFTATQRKNEAGNLIPIDPRVSNARDDIDQSGAPVHIPALTYYTVGYFDTPECVFKLPARRSVDAIRRKMAAAQAAAETPAVAAA